MVDTFNKSLSTAPEKVYKKIKGIKFTSSLPANSHLQFVDDALLSGTASVKEAKAFKQVLT